MEVLISPTIQFFEAFWHYLCLSGPFLFLGLIFGGMVYVWVPVSLIVRWMGGENLSSAFQAALFGVPLPLCSCSVIPTVISLKKSGASKAASSSFAISTPESGVDSLAITYAMMDGLMTVIRPILAFFSALLGGVFQILFNKDSEQRPSLVESPSCAPQQISSENFLEKIKRSWKYSFGDLLDDMSGPFLLGLLLAALMQLLIPENFFLTLNPHLAKIFFLLIGLPLYICASAATPIAAALVLKGISPGTALILLLVGPAISMPNILVLRQHFGTRWVGLNILAVAIVAFFCSYLIDFIYAFANIGIHFRVQEVLDKGASFTFMEQALGGLLFFLLLWSYGRKKWRDKSLGHQHDHHHGDNCGH